MGHNDEAVRGVRAGGLGLALVGLVAACGGGGGGGGGAGALAGITGAQMLARVDTEDAAVTLRTGPGPAGFTAARTMALDPKSDTLYFVDDTLLFKVAARGGPEGLDQAPVPVGRLGFPSTPFCIAWDPSADQLFGVVHQGPSMFKKGKLVRIDPATAEAVDVGPCTPVDSLTYDVATGMLYGLRGWDLHRIDPQTGTSLNLFTEPTYLKDSTALVSDPVTGLFYTAHNPIGGTPGIVSLALNGTAKVVRTHARPLQLLALDGDSGRLFGLTRGNAVVELGTAVQPAWLELGNLGCRLISMSFDPADKTYFGVNLDTDLAKSLVKLRLDGRRTTIGALGADIGSIAYDPVTRELWGFDDTARKVVSIDPGTAATSPTGVPTLSAGTRLAIDPLGGDLYGYDGQVGMTLLIDPATSSINLLANNIGVQDVGGLEYDPVGARLIAGSNPIGGQSRFSTWSPYASGPAAGILNTSFAIWAVGRDSQSGLLHTLDGSMPGFELGSSGTSEVFALDPGSAAPRSVGSLWNGYYRAAVRVGSLARGFAIDATSVYSFDLASGETELVGSAPFAGGATGITWDPDRGLLGFLAGNEIRWTGPSTPWNAPQKTSLGNTSLELIARDPSNGLYYACDKSAVYTVAVNGATAVVLQLGSAPAGVDPTDMAWSQGRLFVAADDQRLYRVDPSSGAWTDVGRSAFQMVALY